MEPAPAFVAPVEFTFDGLVIRPYRPGDGPALATATVESYDHLRPTMPWAVSEYPIDQAELQARRMAADYLSQKDYPVGLWDGERLLGGSGFHMRQGPVEWKASEIGMWIRVDAAGKGLGTRFLRAMLEWGFTEWGFERLVWRCDTTNLASASVARKCGMVLEGTNRGAAAAKTEGGARPDTYFFAMLRSDWLAS
ncbi:MAG: GNAT family N-acetyltransferase [Armatimonadetes bacterium]|nr:GNAT family N-acetyltransferase [Armatimonadota bacterium]